MTAHPDAADPAHAQTGVRLIVPLLLLRVTRLGQDALTILQRAFTWWIGELVDLLPPGLRERLAATERRLTIVLGAGEALVILESAGAAEALGRRPLDTAADLATALRSLLQQPGLQTVLGDRTLSVGLRLAPDKVLRTKVDLPLAAEANLDEVIMFELDRHTPFRADQAYVSARILRRDTTTRRLDVELTVAPRPVVEDAVALADRLGLRIDRIDAAARSEAAPASGNLLPQARLAATRRKAGRLTYGLAVATAALAVIAIGLPLLRMQREAAATERQFANVRVAVALQNKVDALRKQRLFVVERKRAAISVSAILLELTRILPDDTTLTTLRITGDEVEIGGTARSAAALIDLLERSHRFTDTKFRTPVTQDPVTGRESFYIVAQSVGTPAS
jgi:general secretion pathway protein L